MAARPTTRHGRLQRLSVATAGACVLVLFASPLALATYDLVLPDGTRIPTVYNYTCPVTNTSSLLSAEGCECTLFGTSPITQVSQALTLFGTTPSTREVRAYRANHTQVALQCDANGACGVCPRGTQCQWANVTHGGTEYRVSTCAPCLFGQLCPEGTVNPFSERFVNLCEAGQLCREPSILEGCPSGFFCPHTAFKNVSCEADVNGERLGFEGNYCPENSSHPLAPCPAGSYCPSPSERDECPAGHYCPSQSLEPRACWALSGCKRGSSNPPFSWLGFIIVLGAFVAFFGVGLAFQSSWRHRQRVLKGLEVRHERFSRLRSALLRVGNPGLEVFQPWGLRRKHAVLDFEFHGLGLTVGNRQIISGVSGKFHAGRLTAIMGPSGSGKSSFLKALCGKAWYGKTQGELLINGERRPVESVKREIGFVPQDDVVHRKLTVRENFMYSAFLRLDRRVSAKRRTMIVDDVIEMLHLSHVQDTMVGGRTHRGISGGEVKRVNVGIELVADPTALFVDEATSGLDSNTAYELVETFANLAKRFRWTIAMVIHQPRYSIFDNFHDLALLGRGGELVYFGAASTARAYFEDIGYPCPMLENPSDFFLDVIAGHATTGEAGALRPAYLVEQWKQRRDDPKYQTVGKQEQGEGQGQGGAGGDDVASLLGGNSAVLHAFHTIMHDIDPAHGERVALRALEEFLLSLQVGLSEGDVGEFVRSLDTDGNGEIDRLELFRALQNSDTLAQAKPKKPHRRQHVKVTNEEEMALFDDAPSATPRARAQQPPSAQFLEFCHRAAVKWWRTRKSRIIDMGLILLSAFVLGSIQGSAWSLTSSPGTYLLAHLALALLTCVASLHIFSASRVLYWREAAAGVSKPAFFLAKVLVDLGDVLLRTVIFTAAYYGITQPDIAFEEFVLVNLALSWAWSGIGYSLSLLLEGPSALVAAVAVPLVSGGFFSGVNPTLKKYEGNLVMEAVLSASPNRWSIEAAVLRELEAEPSHLASTADLLIDFVGYNKDNFHTDLLVLGLMGLGFRVLAYLAMVFCDRGQQK